MTRPYTSESVLEDLDRGRPPRGDVHARDVEPDPRRIQPSREEEHLGELSELPLLAPRDGLERSAEARPQPGLHLAEDQEPALLHYEVELAQRTSPVPRH